jgi:hypothetical protein
MESEGEDIKTGRQLLREIHADMKYLRKKSDRVDNVLFGDKEAHIDGLVDTVAKHRKWISLDKKIKYSAAVAAASTAGAGIGFWDNLKHIIKSLLT